MNQLKMLIPIGPRTVIAYVCMGLTAIITGYILYNVIRSHMDDKGPSKWYFEEMLFIASCLVSLIFDIYRFILFNYSPTRWHTGWTSMVFYSPDFLYPASALLWSAFLDYTVHRSKERLSKSCRMAIIPFLAMYFLAIMMTLFEIMIAKGQMPGVLNGQRVTQYLWYPYYLVEIVSSLAFIFTGYKTVKEYHIKRVEPPFLRLDYAIYPWLIGFAVTNLFGLYIMSFFSAISAFMVHRALMRRFTYLDYETGAYKQKILGISGFFARQIKFHPNTAFVLKVPAGEEALIDIIKYTMPDGSVILRMDKGPFVVLSETRSRLSIEVFQKNIQDAGINHNPPVSVFCSYYSKLGTESVREFVQGLQDKV